MMNRTWSRYMAALLISILVLTVNGWSATSKFPDKPLEFVVQVAAGAASDIFVRQIAKMILDQKFVSVPIRINNQAGGGGAIASNYLKGRKGSPYYLLHAAGAFIDAPLLDPNVPGYKDVTPIALIMIDSTSAVVRADSPYKTIKDLVDAAKKGKPGNINWGVTGIGASNHMIGLKLEEVSGARFTFVPFTGTNEVTSALMGGHIQVGSLQPNIAMPLVEAGRVRILAVANEKRVSCAPNAPTFREQGFDVVVYNPRGFAAPAGISANAEGSLSGIFEKLSQSSQWKEYVTTTGTESVFLPSDKFKKFLEEETAFRDKMFRKVGLIK
jgi:putative tricarboxylic transport membrane protein